MGRYAPQGTRDEEHDLFLQQVVGLIPGGQVVVAGDLNGHVQYRDSKPAAQRTSEAWDRVRAFTEGSELCDAARCFTNRAGRRKHTFRSRALGVVGRGQVHLDIGLYPVFEEVTAATTCGAGLNTCTRHGSPDGTGSVCRAVDVGGGSLRSSQAGVEAPCSVSG